MDERMVEIKYLFYYSNETGEVNIHISKYINRP